MSDYFTEYKIKFTCDICNKEKDNSFIQLVLPVKDYKKYTPEAFQVCQDCAKRIHHSIWRMID